MSDRKTRRGRVVCATLAAAALLAAVATDAGAFTVHGTIENGTTGTKNVSATITVVNPSKGMEEESLIEAKDGRFEIPGLDAGAPIYLLQVTYDDVMYNTPVRVTGADQDVTITVYERATSWDGIKVTVPHIAVSRRGEELAVEQMYEISNESSPPRTAGGGTGDFHLYLPNDAENVVCQVTTLDVPIEREPEATDTPGKYRIDYPIRPGLTRVNVTYSLPYASGAYTLRERMFQDVGHVMVYAVDPAIKVTSASHELQAQEAVHGMAPYLVHGVVKDAELVLAFEGGDPAFAGTGGTQGGEGTGGGEGNVIVVPGDSNALSNFLIAALLMVFAAVVLMGLRDSTSPLSDPKVLRGHYDKLIARIARLDDLHAAEAIPPEAYRAAREELMARTAALAMHMRAQETTHPTGRRHGAGGTEPAPAHPTKAR